MRHFHVSTLLGLAAAASLCSAPPVQAGDDHEKVTVVGCAVKGDSDGDGFLLANAVERTTRMTSEPGATGSTVTTETTTEARPSRTLYWLDDDDHKVEPHMGHQVEIVGELEGDIETGEVKVEREDDAVKIEIDADGRKATVRLVDVPSAIATSGSGDVDDEELKYLVRKLDVKSVRMLAATCQ
jgi:hypothetical protein